MTVYKNNQNTQFVVIGSFGNHITLIDENRKVFNFMIEDDYEELCKYTQCTVKEYSDWALSFIKSNTYDLVSPPEVFSTWQHIHSGALYAVAAITNTERSDSRRGEFTQTVIYEDINTGNSWSRPLVDFLSNVTPYNP